FNLVEGTQLEVEMEADGVRLRIPTGGGSLRRKQGILVHHGSGVVPLDVAEFIRGERDARALQLAAALLQPDPDVIAAEAVAL
ncbi:MAG: hypothetical protein WCP63_12695, partial [Cyanobium sp. ELA712]